MRGSGLAVVALALALPAPCGGRRGAEVEAHPAASAVTAPSSPAPTAPPVWMPPETATPVVEAAPAAVEPADAGRALSPEMKKAIVAFEKGDHKKVRALLEKKVRAGKGTGDEARLVATSCAALGDKACAEAMKTFGRD